MNRNQAFKAFANNDVVKVKMDNDKLGYHKIEQLFLRNKENFGDSAQLIDIHTGETSKNLLDDQFIDIEHIESATTASDEFFGCFFDGDSISYEKASFFGRRWSSELKSMAKE